MRPEGAVRAIVVTATVASLTIWAQPEGVTSPGRDEPAETAGPYFFSPRAVAQAFDEVYLLGEDDPPGSGTQATRAPREFYFSRAIYNGFGRGFFQGGRSWATDFPKADRIFLSFIDRLLSNLDAYEEEHPIPLDDPETRHFPFLYALEVGRMDLTPPEIEGLRSYLLAGGFLVIDDFWGSREWANFEYQMSLVLPGYSIVDLPPDHDIFTSFYEIEEIVQVPNVAQGVNGGPTYERDGYVPMVKGIHDENGRLMVVINWNTDLGDAWEWADHPYYPLKYSTYAYEMGVNMIVYAMSH
jgi:uncharacterized protein DUF4159